MPPHYSTLARLSSVNNLNLFVKFVTIGIIVQHRNITARGVYAAERSKSRRSIGGRDPGGAPQYDMSLHAVDGHCRYRHGSRRDTDHQEGHPAALAGRRPENSAQPVNLAHPYRRLSVYVIAINASYCPMTTHDIVHVSTRISARVGTGYNKSLSSSCIYSHKAAIKKFI